MKSSRKKLYELISQIGIKESMRLMRDFLITFDSGFYRKNNRHLSARITPRCHYLIYGQRKGFPPNIQFNPLEYILLSQQTQAKSSFPFFHYLLHSSGNHPLTDWDLKYLEFAQEAFGYRRSLVLHANLYHKELITESRQKFYSTSATQEVRQSTNKRFKVTTAFTLNPNFNSKETISIVVNNCGESVFLPSAIKHKFDEIDLSALKVEHMKIDSCASDNFDLSFVDSRILRITAHQPIVISLDGIISILLGNLPKVEMEKLLAHLLSFGASKGTLLPSLAARNEVSFSYVPTGINESSRLEVSCIETAINEMEPLQKILLVSHEDSHTGAPIFLKQLFHQLVQDGYEVHIISIRPNFRNGVFNDLGTAHSYLEGYVNLRRRGNPVLKNWILTQTGELAMEKALAKFKPDLLLANSMASCDSVRIAHRNDVATVLYVHEAWKIDGPNWTTRDVFANRVMQILEVANLVLFGSSATQNHWRRAGLIISDRVLPTYRKIKIPHEKSWSTSRGISRNKLGIPTNALVFLSVATFEPRKRIFDILEAFSRLECEESHLILVGATSLGIPLNMKNMVENKSNIHVVEATRQLEDYYAAADCFVFASEEETMPLVLQEAALLGIPRIVSMYAGYMELIPSEDYAFLFPTGDISALKDRMEFFIQNTEKAMAVAERAKKFQVEKLQENDTSLLDLIQFIYHNRFSMQPNEWSNEND